MWPVLFSVFGVQIPSYGVSKVLAGVVAAIFLGRSFERLGYTKATAYSLVLWATAWGFVGAKAHAVIDTGTTIGWSTMGGTGFAWFGGLIGGTLSVAVLSRRHGLQLGAVAAAGSMPLSLAYGIGAIGCFLAGDAPYGRPADLPWAMAFPNGEVAVNVPVHPAQLYEAAGAFLIAVILWTLQRRVHAMSVFGIYLGLSGLMLLLVEFTRATDPVLMGLTETQLFSIASTISGMVIIILARRRARRTEAAIRATVTLGFGAPDRMHL